MTEDIGWASFHNVMLSALQNVLGSALGEQKNPDDIAAHRQLALAWSEAPDAAREPLEIAFTRGMEICESPIERRLLPWLLLSTCCYSYWEPQLLLPGESELLKPGRLAVIPQLPIGKCRADFAIAGRRAGPVRFVIVECDGVEFHDAEADALRDAHIMTNPRILKVIRFRGSEIYADARKVAWTVADETLRCWRGLS